MLNIARLVKVGVGWMTVSYVVCYVGVAMLPGIRQQFMLYALHTSIDTGTNVLSITNFVIGLVVWDLLAGAGIWLWGVLYNRIK